MISDRPQPPARARALVLLLALTSALVASRARADPSVSILVSPLLGTSDGSTRIVATEGDRRFIITRGARLVADAEHVESGTVFAADILSATPFDDGWVFVTSDGIVARSATFTGPLEILAEVQPPIHRVSSRSRGRIVLVDGHFVPQTLGPDRRIHPVPRFPDGEVLSVEFENERDGVVVHDGGRIAVTHDGAATFVDVPERGLGVMYARFDDGLLVAKTVDGPAILDPATGQASPTTRILPAWTWIDPEDVRRWLAMAGLGDARPDDDFIAVSARGEVYRRTVGAPSEGGEYLGRVTDPNCRTASAFADGYLISCLTHRLFTRDFVSFAPVPWRMSAFTSPGAVSVPRGIAAWTDACEGDRPAHPDRAICVVQGVTDPGRTVEMPFEVFVSSFGGIGPDGPIVYSTLGNASPTPVFQVSATDGSMTRIDVGLGPEGANRHVSDVSVLVDGTVLMTITTYGGLEFPQLFVRAPDHAVVARRLPLGAMSASGIDARRLVVAGRFLHEIWSSEDGGETFEPIPRLLEGRIQRVQIDGSTNTDPYWASEHRIACRGEACKVGTLVRLDFGASPVTTGARLVGRRTAPARFGGLRVASPTGSRDQVSCSADPPSAPSERNRVANRGISLGWETGSRARISWTGESDGRTFTVTRELSPELAELLAQRRCDDCAAADDEGIRVRPHLASRSGLVAEICSRELGRCQIYFVPTRGPIQLLFAGDSRERIDSTRDLEVADAVWLDERRALLWLAKPDERRSRPTYDRIVVLDGDGTVRTDWFFATSPEVERALVSVGSTFELALMDPVDGRVLAGRAIGEDGVAATDDVWPALPLSELFACSSPPAATQRRIRVRRIMGDVGDEHSIGPAWLSLRVEPDALCIERIEGVDRAFVLQASEAGRYTVSTPRGQRWTCRDGR